MRKLAHFFFFVGALSAFAACSSGEDSLGVKGDDSQGNGKCPGPNPSTRGCANGADCPSGMVCDPDACHSSACGCDEATGQWRCTADCATPTCVPEGSGPKCTERNPALGCEGGCPAGTVCDPDACRPGHCECTGDGPGWGCTRDCGGRGACVPEQGPRQCEGPNPAAGCSGGCPSGQVCDPGVCRPSGCACDPETGGWTCTADCSFQGSCVPEGRALCDGRLGTRAPEGDELCIGKPDCFTTSGQPDHVGCPNTCSCVCSNGMCFSGACTDIACGEPNVYR